ncbi:dihydrofolate reductase family protein [Nonomuraea diastatica]|uniref:dihydrofolate reductase family protein n=1 Tax=Nonomuraea diastatica TaxID=1848329 RepID=UPI00140DA854|nr:dihydrofolate reductase family protein [Nonomuraea diastatica]
MKLTVTTFVSLDGVMQSPGGPEEDRSNDFDLGGWLVPYADEDMGAIVGGWFAGADALLLGRRTYDIMAAYWPDVTDPEEGKINVLPKYVASRSPRTLTWQNSHLLEGDLATAVTELKSRPGRELQVHGSGRLIESLLRSELVDELRLLTYPVIVGKGQRLFETGTSPAAWRLTDVKSTGNGVIAHTYQYAGKPAIGTFEVGADGKEQNVLAAG